MDEAHFLNLVNRQRLAVMTLMTVVSLRENHLQEMKRQTK